MLVCLHHACDRALKRLSFGRGCFQRQESINETVYRRFYGEGLRRARLQGRRCGLRSYYRALRCRQLSKTLKTGPDARNGSLVISGDCLEFKCHAGTLLVSGALRPWTRASLVFPASCRVPSWLNICSPTAIVWRKLTASDSAFS